MTTDNPFREKPVGYIQTVSLRLNEPQQDAVNDLRRALAVDPDQPLTIPEVIKRALAELWEREIEARS